MKTAIGALLLALAARAQDITFPPDAGVVDVTKPPYDARGDGRTDDTAAIQRALSDHPNQGAIIYLPAGTYLVSDTLRWPHGSRGGMEEKNTILQGQHRDKVVLRFKDGVAADPSKPKAMIWTGRKPAQRFRNAVRDLTFDTGRGNPGAVGAQFMANNQGCMRDVLIRSGDGRGLIGLDLGYSDENGPCLIRNVHVAGFDVGIRTAFAVDSIVMEHVTVEGQGRCGFENRGQCVSVRGFRSTNEVPAVVNAAGPGLMTLVDSVLTGKGGAKDRAAVSSEAALFLRDVSAPGYARVLEGSDTDGREFVSHPVLSLFGPARGSLRLPVRETPDVPWDPLPDWISPLQHGGRPDDKEDDTAAIQAAVDSGKTTVYLPRGAWLVSGTVSVRGRVRRVIGCEASILLGKEARTREAPVFRIEDGASDVLVMERFRGGYEQGPFVRFEHASKRTLVLRSLTCGQGSAYRNTGGGALFVEDVVGPDWRFGKQQVWARQLNVENEGTHVLNDGGTLWILGFKTERGGTLIDTRGGGRTEVLGGFCYATSGPKTDPMFVVREASLSVTIGESCFNRNPFETLVSETRDGVTKTLRKGEAPGRTGGSMLPLFVGARP